MKTESCQQPTKEAPLPDNSAPKGEFVLYTTEDGSTRGECCFEDETPSLSQALMAELFYTSPQNIILQLESLFEDRELVEMDTCKEYLQVRQEGSIQVKC